MKHTIPLMTILLMIVASCSRTLPPQVHEEVNSVYYWKTEFRLDSIERNFIEQHDIRRLYLRFFDVVAEDNHTVSPQWGKKDILPNATLKFIDSIPKSIIEVVPTVYITLDALKAIKGKEFDAASKIVHRILNMVSYNEVPNVSELQLDCDWTNSTDSIYFKLCTAVRDTLNALSGTDYVLSSTIRLHQLNKAAPPVDYGVLMCYNTGSFKNPKTKNSILDYSDVEPYLRSTIKYPLHLDVAFPTYSWSLCYRDNKFLGILRADSIAHESITKEIENGLYQATANAQIGKTALRAGDYIRNETSDIGTILKVKSLIERRLQVEHRSTILYHLDSKHLKHYNTDEINKIFSRDNI